ncbi:MAG: GntR family transcriptional regulator [Hyphomicrobiaceae bacterium]|nr:GntR family transcriptional regulator [Hyphomicrobiaceae bacterium]
MNETGTSGGRKQRTEAGACHSLTDDAYAALEERIVTLEMPPGAHLSEQTLCQQVGLGRTPVREALQRLAREGLVTVMPRKGVQVTETDPERQLLVLEVRREVERLLSRTAASRANAAQRDELREIADGMERAAETSDDRAFMRLDRAMNLLVMAAAHNEYASGAMRLINGQSRRFWFQHYKAAADLPLCARLHAAQARAIAAGDAQAAACALDRLMDYTEAFARAAADSAPSKC